jgi:hypothetical protein
MGVEGGVVTTCRELPSSNINGREGRSGCELSWAAKRWQKLWGGDGLAQDIAGCHKIARMF